VEGLDTSDAHKPRWQVRFCTFAVFRRAPLHHRRRHPKAAIAAKKSFGSPLSIKFGASKDEIFVSVEFQPADDVIPLNLLTTFFTDAQVADWCMMLFAEHAEIGARGVHS